MALAHQGMKRGRVNRKGRFCRVGYPKSVKKSNQANHEKKRQSGAGDEPKEKGKR